MSHFPPGHHFLLIPMGCLKSLAVNALVALGIGLFMPQSFKADEPAPLPAVLSNCRVPLARLSYMRYTIKATPTRETNHPRNQMRWREDGNKCRYDYFYWRDDSSEGFEVSYSFDGERS